MAGDPFVDDQSITAKQFRLARLRRLYHHVASGGTTNARDELAVGADPTKENIMLTITALEHEVRAAMNQEDDPS